MNSKQLNFFSHPNEISKIFDFLKKNGASITVEPFLTKNYECYSNVDFYKSDKLFFRIIIIKNGENKQNIITNFIVPPNYFLFDHLKSNIIQFDFPKLREKNILNRGRFYFATGYWKGDDFIKKDEEFIIWASNLLKSFKKEFLKFKEPIHNENCTELVKNMYDSKEIDLKHF